MLNFSHWYRWRFLSAEVVRNVLDDLLERLNFQLADIIHGLILILSTFLGFSRLLLPYGDRLLAPGGLTWHVTTGAIRRVVPVSVKSLTVLPSSLSVQVVIRAFLNGDLAKGCDSD